MDQIITLTVWKVIEVQFTSEVIVLNGFILNQKK